MSMTSTTVLSREQLRDKIETKTGWLDKASLFSINRLFI